jgi:hypothetical protein
LAMLAAGVPTATSPRLSKDFHPDRISLAGGDLLHIHYVDWERPSFTALAAALIHGERHSLAGFDFASLLDRPLTFGKCIDHVIAELVLFTDSQRVVGSRSENEQRWRCADNTLLLTRPNGIVTTSFQTLLVHGPRRWLLGPYLFGSFIHFLRLA